MLVPRWAKRVALTWAAARVIAPDPARHRQYEDLFGYYRDTHTALRPLMHRMADRQRASPAA